MDNKQYLKEQISNMSERELLEYSAFIQAQNEKHLDSIRKTLGFGYRDFCNRILCAVLFIGHCGYNI